MCCSGFHTAIFVNPHLFDGFSIAINALTASQVASWSVILNKNIFNSIDISWKFIPKFVPNSNIPALVQIMTGD